LAKLILSKTFLNNFTLQDLSKSDKHNIVFGPILKFSKFNLFLSYELFLDKNSALKIFALSMLNDSPRSLHLAEKISAYS
jgi:hypothetical protein